MNHQIKLQEENDRWLIPMQGYVVTQCRIDYAFGIELWKSDEFWFSIRISGNFICRVNDREYHLSAEHAPTEISPALSIIHKPVELAIAKKDGLLELAFSPDIQITVLPNPQYEAWELSGPKGLHLICTPGGNVAVWDAE